MLEQKEGPKVTFSFRLAPEKLERLHELAKQSNSTASRLMDLAVDEFLDRRATPAQDTDGEVHLISFLPGKVDRDRCGNLPMEV